MPSLTTAPVMQYLGAFPSSILSGLSGLSGLSSLSAVSFMNVNFPLTNRIVVLPPHIPDHQQNQHVVSFNQLPAHPPTPPPPPTLLPPPSIPAPSPPPLEEVANASAVEAFATVVENCCALESSPECRTAAETVENATEILNETDELSKEVSPGILPDNKDVELPETAKGKGSSAELMDGADEADEADELDLKCSASPETTETPEHSEDTSRPPKPTYSYRSAINSGRIRPLWAASSGLRKSAGSAGNSDCDSPEELEIGAVPPVTLEQRSGDCEKDKNDGNNGNGVEECLESAAPVISDVDMVSWSADDSGENPPKDISKDPPDKQKELQQVRQYLYLFID